MNDLKLIINKTVITFKINYGFFVNFQNIFTTDILYISVMFEPVDQIIANLVSMRMPRLSIRSRSNEQIFDNSISISLIFFRHLLHGI